MPRLTGLTTVAAGIGLAAGLMVTGPGTAVAQPSGFPDLAGFTEVAIDPFFDEGGRGPRWVHFSTADDINCHFNGASDNYPALPTAAFNCNGAIPALPASAGTPSPGSCGHVSPGDNGQGVAYAFSWRTDTCGAPPGPVLNPGQKINYRDATCAAGTDGLLACLDTTSGEHGFVIARTGSWAF